MMRDLIIMFTCLATFAISISLLYKSAPTNLPFDPRLCENTGIVERYFVIGKGGVVEHRYAPVLDCSVFDSAGEFVTFTI